MNYINDIPLYNIINDNCQSINVVVEICPGTRDKRELLDSTFDRLVTVRQVCAEYPFYYGSFPQTYAGDKDPLDFILFTDIPHRELDLVKVDVIGAIKTIDAGEQDDKVICVECDCNLINVKKEFKKALKFLKTYKGKDADMTINKKLASMSEAEIIIKQAHEEWKKLIQASKKRINTHPTVIKRNSRVTVIKR